MMENKDIDPLEQLFKSKLENAKVTAPNSVWQGVSAGIGSTATTSVVFGVLIKVIASILVVSSIVVAAVFFTADNKISKSDSPEDNIVAVEKTKPIKSVVSDDVINTNKFSKGTSNNIIVKKEAAKNDLAAVYSSSNNADNKKADLDNNIKNDDKGLKKSNANRPQSPEKAFELIVKSNQKYFCPGQEISFTSNHVLTWSINGKTVARSNDLKYTTIERVDLIIKGVYELGQEKEFTITCSKPNADKFEIKESNKAVFECNYLERNAAICTWYFDKYPSKSGRNTFFSLANDQCSAKVSLILNENNCRDTGVRIVTPKDINVIPFNTFTPGNDNQNKFLELNAKCVDIQHVGIYDSENNLVFNSTEKDPKWDGMNNGILCESGQYMIYVTYMINGVKKHQQRRIILRRK